MTTRPIDQVLEIMRKLRDPEGGCPWDCEQNLETLKPFLIEECYELIDAIDSGDPEKHKDELGDMLLQVVFQVQLRQEMGQFGFDDICTVLAEKLIRRHPHVFADDKVTGSKDVLKKWEEIKSKEKKTGRRSVVDGVPKHLPALMKAHQVQSRAARVGFDWSAIHDVMAKLEEELEETKEAMRSGNKEHIAEEIGDLLFSVVNLSRFQKLHAEELLAATVRKFSRRFQAVEARVHAKGKQMTECSLEELDEYWNEVKRDEKNTDPHPNPLP
jgi:tetrapyrrole methylase family protein/MazG family protein